MNVPEQIQETAANSAAGTSFLAMASSWLPVVQDGLQIVATLIAIVAGTLAAKWHYVKIQGEKQRESNQNLQREPTEERGPKA